ncbi:TPA: SIR2 family protein [Burkholderia vietnamiensis]|nr:SIR2 family protein [Burkholderia vietnamiensis]
MNRRDLQDQETINFLRSVLSSQKCVPFIGTGFTANERAAKNAVPNGTDWMGIMAAQINAAATKHKPTETEIKRYSFQDLSDVYFREKIVEFDKIKETLNDYFSNVKIENEAKKAFLSIEWPYIYTLNIDDAIENHLGGVKVVPYEQFERHGSRTFVYKMHGDVWTALKAADAEGLKLIFGRGDYIRSLRKNEYLIECLRNDLAERNVFFIGCSLTDELDVLYALSDESGDSAPSGVSRIYVTSRYPEDYTTQKKLRDYGITDVLVCDYDEFYLRVKEITLEMKGKALSSDRFIYAEKGVEFSKANFLKYFLQASWRNEDPYFLSTRRTVEDEINAKIRTEPLLVIRGRRFTGKTTLLHRVLHAQAGRKKLFISTAHSIDDRLFNELISLENTLIVVDSGAMPFQHLRTLSRRRDEVRDANSTFVIAISNSDVSAFYGLSVNAIFEAADRLNHSEIPAIDDFLSRIGLKKWRASARILDQIFYVSESAIVARELGESSSLQTRLNNRIEELSKKKECKVEFALLYTLAVRQKIYSAVYRKILSDAGFGRTSEAYMSEFGKNWAPFVELMESDASSDRYNRSARELIANSSVWLHYATRSLAKRIGLDLTADYIFYAFVSSREWDDEAHELTMFDHLNAVFGPFPPIEANWSAALIRLVYLRLADVLYQVPNYWLQRAKSVYNISVDVAELKEAIAFCDKAISETDQKVTINSKLTRANLYGKLCRIMEYKDEDLILQAIKIYYDALQDYDQNSTHINDLLKKSRSGRGDLKLLVSHVDSMPKSAKFITVRSEFSLISGFLAGKIAY